MTKKLKWRLSKLPTPDEVRELVKDKILTNEEAREILFSEEVESEKSADDLKQEIKFLKELVEKLSNNNRSQIIETIRYIEKPYYIQPWYHNYGVWCNAGTSGLNSAVNSMSLSAGGNTDLLSSMQNAIDVNFSAIS